MFLFAFFVLLKSSSSHSWDYHHHQGADWNSHTVPHAQCGQENTQQSPININTGSVTHDTHAQALNLQKYEGVTGGEFFTNGHTFEYKYHQTTIAQPPRFYGGFAPLESQEWCFAQFHFHWGSRNGQGSEHTINGKAGEMEMHFVHYDCQFQDLGEAVAAGGNAQFGGSRTVAVIGVLFQVSDSGGSTELDRIFEYASVVELGHTRQTVTNTLKLDFTKLMPAGKDYWFYEGGLTTPGCNQIVNWYILQEKLVVSTSQLESLRELHDDHGHILQDGYRMTQPLGTRKVYSSTAPKKSHVLKATHKKCDPFVNLGHFSIAQCAQFVRRNPDKCPSKTVMFAPNDGSWGCKCCAEGYTATTDPEWHIYAIHGVDAAGAVSSMPSFFVGAGLMFTVVGFLYKFVEKSKMHNFYENLDEEKI